MRQSSSTDVVYSSPVKEGGHSHHHRMCLPINFRIELLDASQALKARPMFGKLRTMTLHSQFSLSFSAFFPAHPSHRF
jgi:hypothetical protein